MLKAGSVHGSTSSINVLNNTTSVTGAICLDARVETTDESSAVTIFVNRVTGITETKEIYVKLYLSMNGKDVKATKQKTNRNNASVFQEEFVYNITSELAEAETRLQVSVWSASGLRHVFLGGVSLGIADLVAFEHPDSGKHGCAGWFGLLPISLARDQYNYLGASDMDLKAVVQACHRPFGLPVSDRLSPKSIQAATSKQTSSEALAVDNLEDRMAAFSQRIGVNSKSKLTAFTRATLDINVGTTCDSSSDDDNLEGAEQSDLDTKADSEADSKLDSSNVLGLERVVAQYAYQANLERGLSLEPGDIVIVHEKCDSGWWAGKKEADGKVGWFPAAYCTGEKEIDMGKPSSVPAIPQYSLPSSIPAIPAMSSPNVRAIDILTEAGIQTNVDVTNHNSVIVPKANRGVALQADKSLDCSSGSARASLEERCFRLDQDLAAAREEAVAATLRYQHAEDLNIVAEATIAGLKAAAASQCASDTESAATVAALQVELSQAKAAVVRVEGKAKALAVEAAEYQSRAESAEARSIELAREREAEKHALEERELIRAREKLAVKRQHENSLSLSNDRLLAASAEVLEAQEKAASFDAMIVAANDTIKKLRRDIEAQKQDNDREATLVKANHDVVQEELKRRLADAEEDLAMTRSKVESVEAKTRDIQRAAEAERDALRDQTFAEQRDARESQRKFELAANEESARAEAAETEVSRLKSQVEGLNEEIRRAKVAEQAAEARAEMMFERAEIASNTAETEQNSRRASVDRETALRASLEAQREEARETASALRACEVELETVQKKIESQEALKSENYHLHAIVKLQGGDVAEQLIAANTRADWLQRRLDTMGTGGHDHPEQTQKLLDRINTLEDENNGMLCYIDKLIGDLQTAKMALAEHE